MKTTRLKNIVILILLLADAFLLLLLISRHYQHLRAREDAVTQLITLFERSGISLPREVVAEDALADTLDLSRSIEQEHDFAQALLGEVSTVDAGGGVYRYYNANGTCLFRSTGAFQCNATVSVADPEAFCRQISQTFGYSDITTAAEADGSLVIRAVRVNDRAQTVFNCGITFTFSAGRLLSVSGSYIPSEYAALTNPDCVDAVSALTAFLDFRNGSGIICTEVSSMSLGYLLQSTASAPMRLVPVWCIRTSAGEFYVNLITSEVLHG